VNLDTINQLTPEDLVRLDDKDPGLAEAVLRRLSWLNTARVDQIPDDEDFDWYVWLMLGGRGSGKTRAAAEWASWLSTYPNFRIGIVSPTASDIRRVLMEGESGIIASIPEMRVNKYNRSLSEVYLNNGSSILGFAATEPDRIRGNQFHALIFDELAAYGKNLNDAWDNGVFANRLKYNGREPRIFVATTPRPLEFLRSLKKDPSTRYNSVSTYANRANLAQKAIKEFERRYGGTRVGRQELGGEILDEVEGSLVSSSMIHYVEKESIYDPDELTPPDLDPSNLVRIVVSLDPSGGHKSVKGNDEVGLVVVAKYSGKTESGNDIAIVLEDASEVLSPEKWAERAVRLYYEYFADCIVAETNFGGSMVETTIRSVDPNVKVVVVTASRGKLVRFEPVAHLYERHQIWHRKRFEKLEKQLVLFTYDGYQGERSPDRADAVVWALTELLLDGVEAPVVGASLISSDRKSNVQPVKGGIQRWGEPTTFDQTSDGRLIPVTGRHSRMPVVSAAKL